MDEISKIIEKTFILFFILVLISIFARHSYALGSTDSTVSVSDHISPNSSGIATLNNPTTKLIITSSSLPVTLTINSDTTDPTIDFSSLITGGSGSIPQMSITANNASNVVIEIPASTITSADSLWDGIMNAPITTTMTLPTVSGENRSLSMAIEIGLGGTELSFSKAVRMIFPGQKEKRVIYTRTGSGNTEITSICDSATDQTVMDIQLVGGSVDCKINSGNDLVVWTKHFTKFGVFGSSSTSSSSSSSSSTSSTSSPPVCYAQKPSSAPILQPAKAGTNSVTLTWFKAGDPVTKYLVAYGTNSGAMQYGNPDVGNSDTTSTVVDHLSAGTTYYFKVKAVNDCNPGDFSNVVSMSPFGISTTTGTTSNSESTPATGYIPVEEIAQYLFDIALTIDNAVIEKSTDLVAQVVFSNFGNVPTLVNMVFSIEDSTGNKVFSETSDITVESERVLRKDFPNLNIGVGKYTLILNTTYGNNVKDEFRQNFEIKILSPTNLKTTTLIWYVLILVIVSVLSYYIYKYFKESLED